MNIILDKEHAAYHDQAQKFWDTLYKVLGEQAHEYNARNHQRPLVHLFRGDENGQYRTEFPIGLKTKPDQVFTIRRDLTLNPEVLQITAPDWTVLRTWAVIYKDGEVKAESDGEWMAAEAVARWIIARLTGAAF